MQEIWLPIPGYVEYEASNLGRIRSVRRDKILKLSYHWRTKYGSVSLGRLGGSHLVHRLIALTFLGEPIGQPWVNHKNGDRADNRLENLEWGTASHNILHKTRVLGNGALARHPRTRFTEKNIQDIRQKIQSGRTHRSLADEYKVSKSTISAIASGQNWKRLA
jgi:hypothetical protein